MFLLVLTYYDGGVRLGVCWKRSCPELVQGPWLILSGFMFFYVRFSWKLNFMIFRKDYLFHELLKIPEYLFSKFCGTYSVDIVVPGLRALKFTSTTVLSIFGFWNSIFVRKPKGPIFYHHEFDKVFMIYKQLGHLCIKTLPD